MNEWMNEYSWWIYIYICMRQWSRKNTPRNSSSHFDVSAFERKWNAEMLHYKVPTSLSASTNTSKKTPSRSWSSVLPPRTPSSGNTQLAIFTIMDHLPSYIYIALINCCRRFKSSDIATSISKGAPDFCTVYTISKGRVTSTRKASRTLPMPSGIVLSPSSRSSQVSEVDLSIPITSSMHVGNVHHRLPGYLSTNSSIASPAASDNVQ